MPVRKEPRDAASPLETPDPGLAGRARPWWWLPPATALLAVVTLAVSAFSWGLEALSPQSGATLRMWLWNDPRLVVVSDVSWLVSPGGMPWVNSVAHLGGVAFAAGYWYFFGLGIHAR